jgi:hypothetical protein
MRANLRALAVLALIAAVLNACATPKSDYWGKLATGVSERSR